MRRMFQRSTQPSSRFYRTSSSRRARRPALRRNHRNIAIREKVKLLPIARLISDLLPVRRPLRIAVGSARLHQFPDMQIRQIENINLLSPAGSQVRILARRKRDAAAQLGGGNGVTHRRYFAGDFGAQQRPVHDPVEDEDRPRPDCAQGSGLDLAWPPRREPGRAHERRRRCRHSYGNAPRRRPRCARHATRQQQRR